MAFPVNYTPDGRKSIHGPRDRAGSKLETGSILNYACHVYDLFTFPGKHVNYIRRGALPIDGKLPQRLNENRPSSGTAEGRFILLQQSEVL